MMNAFPPNSDRQVTLANWRTSPFNEWGFQHVREIVPTADISNNPDDLWRLPPVDSDFSNLSIEVGKGDRIALDAFLASTQTDAFVVVHRGRVLHEFYGNGMGPATPHILMSVSKSMLGLLVGVLAANGILDVDAPAQKYVPELGGSAFQDATLRQLLDMRSALVFDEDYLAASGPMIEYRKATNWNPLVPGERATNLRAFLPTLLETSGPHGGAFNYTSPCADLLGWIIERAANRRYADLFSEYLWAPMGAAHHCYITVDSLGAPRCAGGMCMTALDLARVGQLITDGGRRGSRQIVPEAWIDDIATAGDPQAWLAGSFVYLWPDRPIHYRSQWYVERGEHPMLYGFGIHGQHLFVDRYRQIVVVKFSSQAAPLDNDAIQLTSRYVDAIRDALDES
ncbi:MAG: serine hydrolase domain-containing protein [Hyphomicrobiaceae bacterium]